MATVDSAVRIRTQTRSERLVRLLSRTPLHIALVGIALVWLVPTVGLALTSFRKEATVFRCAAAPVGRVWILSAVLNGAGESASCPGVRPPRDAWRQWRHTSDVHLDPGWSQA